MKVDFYIGRWPQTPGENIAIDSMFVNWYKTIQDKVDGNVIALTSGSDSLSRFRHRIERWSGYRLLMERRKGSLLHIVSINLVNLPASVVSQRPFVVSCHDAIIFEPAMVELTEWQINWRNLSAFRRIMQRANRIITVSQYSRNRLSQLCKIDGEKFDVVHNGVQWASSSVVARVKSPERLRHFGFAPGKFNILYVGSESPRKNLERVIQAIALVRKDMDVHFVKIGIVFGRMDAILRELARTLKLEDFITFSPPVKDTDLPEVYSLADVFVFPSIYEGFGKPPLEAMVQGCPVVSSDLTSLAEVLGDAALFVDPYDPVSIANGIVKVLSDKECRDDLIAKGKRQASKFTYEREGEEILKVYDKVH